MFGYVRPAWTFLTQDQQRQYQSAYCGLCHEMGRRHGFWARMTLNYDFTLLVILLQACKPESQCHALRCPIHLLQTSKSCLCGDAVQQVADVSMILFWHKLDDDVRDSGLCAGLPSRLVRWWFKKSYRRAADANREFDLHVQQKLSQLTELEKSGSTCLDEIAHQFASILAAVADNYLEQNQARILHQALYHIGRWIYLMDAWDDLEEDQRRGRYNPIAARFGGRACQERDYIDTTCTHSIRLAISAIELLQTGQWSCIVENILFAGIPAVQAAVMDGRWKEVKSLHKGRHRNERSV